MNNVHKIHTALGENDHVMDETIIKFIKIFDYYWLLLAVKLWNQGWRNLF